MNYTTTTLGTYISRNGAKVVTELLDKNFVRRTVYLPANSLLRKAGIDGFYKNKGNCPEYLSQITAFNLKKGILTQGHKNVKNLIQTIKKFRLNV